MLLAFLVGVIVGLLLSLYFVRKERFASQAIYINPGFGESLGEMIGTVPDYTSSIDDMSKNWNEGSFGKLVSLIEERKQIPTIKNLI